MSKPKVRKFQFSIPITEIKNSDGLFRVKQTGELLITATGKIAASLGDIPPVFAESGEVKVIIDSVDYGGTEILPIFFLSEAAAMLNMITVAAYNHLHTIFKTE